MICMIDECQRTALTKKLCARHYEEQRLAKLGPCKSPDCERKQNARGFCTKHYIEDISKDKPQCTYSKCLNNQYVTTSTLCKYHYDLDIGSVMKGRYGIGLDEFDAMMEAQNHRCAICKKHISEIAAERFKRFSVDHDHATGEVRGLLCQKCNLSLGNFKDKVSLLRNAIAYLEKGKGKK